MTSPLILLVFGAVISGVLGSLFIIISLAVDSWEEVTFSTDVLSKYQTNNSEYYCVVATSSSNFSLLRHNKTEIKNGNLTSSFQYYYLYSTYSGVWRMCDTLSGNLFQS